MANPIKRMLLGRAMNSGSLAETLLPKRLALPVFCSDPLSSVAHATEQILLVLVVGGAYAVSKDSLGAMPALVGASALRVDYLLTVAA